MEKVELNTRVREEFGKAAVGRLRRDGLIPAVVYRHGEKPTAVKLLKKDFLKALHTKAGENVIISLKIAKVTDTDKPRTTSKTVLIKEIQEHPVSDDIIHIDFNEISLTEKIEVKVPIAEKGEAIGVKRDEGILEHILWEVEVECLPTQIPEKLEVDVSNLEIGGDIFIRDIAVPEGVKILEDSESIVFSVKAPKAEELPTPEEAAAAEAEEPEVIRERKPETEEEVSGEAPEEKPREKKEKESKQ